MASKGIMPDRGPRQRVVKRRIEGNVVIDKLSCGHVVERFPASHPKHRKAKERCCEHCLTDLPVSVWRDLQRRHG